MEGLAPSKRKCERLSLALHERLPFVIVKISHNPTTVFEGSVYDPIDRHTVLVEFEANNECDQGKSLDERSVQFEEISDDEGRESLVYLVPSGASGLRKLRSSSLT